MPKDTILSDIKELSYEELRNVVSAAINPSRDDMAMPMMANPPYRYIERMYPDRVIVEVCGRNGQPDTYYEIPFTVNADDTITFGDAVQVERGPWQPVVKTESAKSSGCDGSCACGQR